MKARDALDLLVREKGRKALLRSELVALSTASQSSCDRALRWGCREGVLVRVGQGIYGIGNAKVVEIVPEIMPKLGYRIEPAYRVEGYSQKLAGNAWNVDRACRRAISKHGVHAIFKSKNGATHNVRRANMTERQPSKRDIERHFHRFEYCQSLARAEKDLIVQRALAAFETFQDERVVMAMEGGTALAYYHRLISRFSDDLDIRLVLRETADSSAYEQRNKLVHDVGNAFSQHVHHALPFLQSTKKGRIRRDGVLQSFIFDYAPKESSSDVLPGLKLEIAYMPLRCSLGYAVNTGSDLFPVVDWREIIAGKLQSLASRLPTHGDSNPSLVRHLHDIGAMAPSIFPIVDDLHEITFTESVTAELLSAVLDEINKDVWRNHYIRYMEKMGTATIGYRPGQHLDWIGIQSRFERVVTLLMDYDQSHHASNSRDADDKP